MSEKEAIQRRLADLERMRKLIEAFLKRPPNATVH